MLKFLVWIIQERTNIQIRMRLGMLKMIYPDLFYNWFWINFKSCKKKWLGRCYSSWKQIVGEPNSFNLLIMSRLILWKRRSNYVISLLKLLEVPSYLSSHPPPPPWKLAGRLPMPCACHVLCHHKDFPPVLSPALCVQLLLLGLFVFIGKPFLICVGTL